MSDKDAGQLRLLVSDNNRDPQTRYRALWEHYYPRLMTYIASFKKIAPADYNDIVSEILLKLFKNLEKYNPVYALSTWVYAVARNYVLDLLRKPQHTGSVSIERMPEQYLIDQTGQNNILEDIIEQDMIGECKQVIDTLKEGDRRLIFLKYYENLNSREIALIEGVSASTVRQRLMVIRAAIKKRIGGIYED